MEMRFIVYCYESRQWVSNYPSFSWAFILQSPCLKKFTWKLLYDALRDKEAFVLSDTESALRWGLAHDFFNSIPNNSDFKNAYIVGE